MKNSLPITVFLLLIGMFGYTQGAGLQYWGEAQRRPASIFSRTLTLGTAFGAVAPVLRANGPALAKGAAVVTGLAAIALGAIRGRNLWKELQNLRMQTQQRELEQKQQLLREELKRGLQEIEQERKLKEQKEKLEKEFQDRLQYLAKEHQEELEKFKVEWQRLKDDDLDAAELLRPKLETLVQQHRALKQQYATALRENEQLRQELSTWIEQREEDIRQVAKIMEASYAAYLEQERADTEKCIAQFLQGTTQ